MLREPFIFTAGSSKTVVATVESVKRGQSVPRANDNFTDIFCHCPVMTWKQSLQNCMFASVKGLVVHVIAKLHASTTNGVAKERLNVRSCR